MADGQSAENALLDTDCAAVGFSGEGRCIEPATVGRFCVDHARCEECGQPIRLAPKRRAREQGWWHVGAPADPHRVIPPVETVREEALRALAPEGGYTDEDF